jgi:F-type H+-transporting ATPase subunit a
MNWLIGAAYAAEAAGEHGGKGRLDPMHQFEIERFVPIKLFGIDVSFTNSAFWMILAITLITGFLLYSMRHASIVPGRFQSAGEVAYEFVANMVRENAGDAGMKYFPLIFTIFMFILALNVLGMIHLPLLGAFTVTSHIAVTFAMAIFVFLVVTGVGLAKSGLSFFKRFAPTGVPLWLMPLVIPVEIISYLTRPISLAVRLFANMMAGHTMLYVFGSFVVGLGILGGWAPLLFMIFITGLEFLVAFLQAYVFAVLSSIYLDDAIHSADH